MYAYSSDDAARLCPEAPKGAQLPGGIEDTRGAFDRDRARVLHSAALRRLADKTQVVSPQTGDTPRTRLTHSLEVGQISRGIALGLGVNPHIAELAGLSHDIGHPPYGHNGEDALNIVADDCGGFEGNAQTLRILTRLEPKILNPATGDSAGLNLTRASLDAVCKYPWAASVGDGPAPPPGATRRRKYSAYDEDADLLQWVRSGAPSQRRCLEAQIMDMSDDIAYSVHDVEDGIVSGRISLAVLWDLVELAALAQKGAKAFGGDPDALLDAADRLRQLPVIAAAAEYDGSLRAMVNIKAVTSQLVGRYVSATVAATLHRVQAAGEGATPEGSTPSLGRYRADFIVPEEVLAEVTLLKSLAVLYVMDEQRHHAEQQRERDRIFRVVEYLAAAGASALDPMFAAWWEAAGSERARLRVVIDQVASMTESRLERLDRDIARVTTTWA